MNAKLRIQNQKVEETKPQRELAKLKARRTTTIKNNNNETMIVRNTVSENLPAWQTRKPNLQNRILQRDMLAVSRFVNMKRKAIFFDAAAIAAIFSRLFFASGLRFRLFLE